MEARYPFLDPKVVQEQKSVATLKASETLHDLAREEFLWLAPEVKNREYKASLNS